MGLTIVKWKGIVTADAFLDHVKRLTSDPDWPPHKRLQLADLRAASLDGSMDHAAFKEAADLYGRHANKLASLKGAAVAGNNFHKAIEGMIP